MRAIDADAMIDRLKEWDTKDKTDKALYNFTLSRINEQPTIQPEPHWIPVDLENNEPPLEEWVLVSSDGYVMQDCIVERGGERYGITAGTFRMMTDICPCPNLTRGWRNEIQ